MSSGATDRKKKKELEISTVLEPTRRGVLKTVKGTVELEAPPLIAHD